MKFKYYLILLMFLGFSGFSQVLHNATVEIVGSPTWVKTVSLEKDGVVLILKEDQTRIKVIKYDINLIQIWEQSLFIDTEQEPTSINVRDNKMALVFSETSGMYYQVIDFDLENGEYKVDGFEVRDFFQDKDLLMFDDKVVMVGTTEKGIAYFIYESNQRKGYILETELSGSYEIQEVGYSGNQGVKILATEKLLGYKNEKKKKGEYLKSTQIISVELDLDGKLQSRKIITQWETKFPLTAKTGSDERSVSGIYQEPDGARGLYFSFLDDDVNKPTFSVSILSLVGEEMSSRELKRFMENVKFFATPPKFNSNDIFVGGILYQPMYQSGTQNVGVDPVSGQRRSERYTVFLGVEFSKAFIFQLSYDGGLLRRYDIDVNQVTRDLNVPFIYNNAGAAAFISNAVLKVMNFEISTRPILYRLSEDSGGKSVAGYTRVSHWYDNVFLALGQQDKVEAYQLEEDQKAKPSKKSKTRPFIQTRRTYFITAVLSGQSN